MTRDSAVEEGEGLHAANMEATSVSIDAEAYPEIRIDYQGQWYRLVKNDDGLELEEIDDVD